MKCRCGRTYDAHESTPPFPALGLDDIDKPCPGWDPVLSRSEDVPLPMAPTNDDAE